MAPENLQYLVPDPMPRGAEGKLPEAATEFRLFLKEVPEDREAR